MLAHACVLSTHRRLRQEDFCDSEATLGYAVSSRLSWATMGDPVSTAPNRIRKSLGKCLRFPALQISLVLPQGLLEGLPTPS